MVGSRRLIIDAWPDFDVLSHRLGDGDVDALGRKDLDPPLLVLGLLQVQAGDW